MTERVKRFLEALRVVDDYREFVLIEDGDATIDGRWSLAEIEAALDAAFVDKPETKLGT
jgi:hypothetical protein